MSVRVDYRGRGWDSAQNLTAVALGDRTPSNGLVQGTIVEKL